MSAPPEFRFIHNIQDGGFRYLPKVEENTANEHFVVKLVRNPSDEDLKRTDNEIPTPKIFIHPHIVRLKEVVPKENMHAIVMELGGQSLTQLVSSHNERGVLVDCHIVYQVMVDISSALCFMHNHETERTAHGDVKLENILLFGDGRAKLCDLGAAESDDLNETGGVPSIQYVSPERMEDPTCRASASADVWALGIVLHWLLFGKPPFTSESSIRLLRDIGKFKPSQIGTSCGEKERELLIRMLDPDCGSRLTSKQLVESKILRCLINTTKAGWKLSEMRSRETEKRVGDLEATLRESEAKVAELQHHLKSVVDGNNPPLRRTIRSQSLFRFITVPLLVLVFLIIFVFLLFGLRMGTLLLTCSDGKTVHIPFPFGYEIDVQCE